MVTPYEDQRTQRLVLLPYGEWVFALAMDLETELMTRRIGKFQKKKEIQSIKFPPKIQDMRSDRYEDKIAKLPVYPPLLHHHDPLLFA